MIPQNTSKTKHIPGRTNAVNPPVNHDQDAHERIITALQSAGYQLVSSGQYSRLIVARGAA